MSPSSAFYSKSSTLIIHPTNLDVQIADRNSAGIIKISNDNLPFLPLSQSMAKCAPGTDFPSFSSGPDPKPIISYPDQTCTVVTDPDTTKSFESDRIRIRNPVPYCTSHLFVRLTGIIILRSEHILRAEKKGVRSKYKLSAMDLEALQKAG